MTCEQSIFGYLFFFFFKLILKAVKSKHCLLQLPNKKIEEYESIHTTKSTTCLPVKPFFLLFDRQQRN